MHHLEAWSLSRQGWPESSGYGTPYRLISLRRMHGCSLGFENRCTWKEGSTSP